MKAKTRSIIESVVSKLAAVAAGAEYVNDVAKVVGGQRSFDVTELEGGVCVCVAFAGSELKTKAPNAPQQISELALVVEAHKYKDPDSDLQSEGLDLLADVERALLGNTDYLKPKGYVRRFEMFIEAEDIGISKDETAIVATSVITIPYIKQYANPHEE